MLTRLKVSGFKNLVDVDIRFGPFTCIAGANAVGKSNLFDAIRFLSVLAEGSLTEAAASIRGAGSSGDFHTLFHHTGSHRANEMAFEIEMIVPDEGEDDLGETARATTNFLRYTLILGIGKGDRSRPSESLQILKEELLPIPLNESVDHLPFARKKEVWRRSALKGSRRTSPFISTDTDSNGRTVVNRYQDAGHRGRARMLPAQSLKRTVVSASNAAESPTALLARNEMRSWRLLQLEPSALRQPDTLSSESKLGADGSHLPATLRRLADMDLPAEVYNVVANRLAVLIPDVREIAVDVDESRRILTLMVRTQDGTFHPGRSLSDGTLRFLALTAIEIDPREEGLICFEEPENGIHPARIPAMLRLLEDIAVSLDYPVDSDNPLRQIIINTHSPSVVAQIHDMDLLVAELREKVESGRRYKRALFSCLPETWRSDANPPSHMMARGTLLGYLNPTAFSVPELITDIPEDRVAQRVMDRADLQIMIPHSSDTHE